MSNSRPALQHADDLLPAGRESDWALSIKLNIKESVEKWIAAALAPQDRGKECAFSVFLKSQNRSVDRTRYMDTKYLHKGVETGWTWYSSSVWGTAINPECRYLLLNHAFEDWNAIRVQLKTDADNLHSQRATLKLGAKLEGKLRNHSLRLGSIRDIP